jgi:hypothetical protein
MHATPPRLNAHQGIVGFSPALTRLDEVSSLSERLHEDPLRLAELVHREMPSIDLRDPVDEKKNEGR